MPLKKLRAKGDKPLRGGENPCVVIDVFEEAYNEFKQNYDELPENDPDRAAIKQTFEDFGVDEIPEDENDFGTARGDWDQNTQKKFADEFVSKWFEVEETEK